MKKELPEHIWIDVDCTLWLTSTDLNFKKDNRIWTKDLNIVYPKVINSVSCDDTIITYKTSCNNYLKVNTNIFDLITRLYELSEVYILTAGKKPNVNAIDDPINILLYELYRKGYLPDLTNRLYLCYCTVKKRDVIGPGSHLLIDDCPMQRGLCEELGIQTFDSSDTMNWYSKFIEEYSI